jgi:hypothetical protein
MCEHRTLMYTVQGPRPDATTSQVIRLALILDIAHYVPYSMLHTV